MKNQKILKILAFILYLSGSGHVNSAQGIVSSSHVGIAYKRLAESQKDYRLALLTRDSTQIAEMIYILGKRYVGTGNYYKARQLFMQSLGMRLRKFGTAEDIAKIYTRLCELEFWRDDPEGVLAYAKLAILYYSKAKSVQGTVNGYRMIAGAHGTGWKRRNHKQKLTFVPSLDSAFYYCYKALNFQPHQQLPIDIAITLENLGQLWRQKNNMPQGLICFHKALEIYERENLLRNAVAISVEIAKSHLELQQSSLAKKWLDHAETLSAKIGGLTEQGILEKETVLASYYKYTRQWEKAFEHQNKSNFLQIRQLETYQEGVNESIRLGLMDEVRNGQLKSQKLKLVINEQKLQIQLFIIFTTFLLLGIAIFTGTVYFRRAKLNAKLIQEQSHRIKNNLQSISDLLSLQLQRLSDPIAVTAMTESLSRVDALSMIHRDLCYGKNLIWLEPKKFIPELIRNILKTYGLELVVTKFDIESIWLHVDQAILLSLILNELTTNSCKYALINDVGSSITLICIKKQNLLWVTFKDSGKGFNLKYNVNSFGLRLIELLTQQLKGSYSFSNDHGSVFKLSFLLTLKSNEIESLNV